jgi:NADPH:quinone reductase-like Zn-dependent oxidoreductase
MRAVRLEGHFGIENLRLGESKHEALGPLDVQICIHAASLNYRDLLMVKGEYNPKQALPLVPCSDGAGQVTAIGASVTRFKVGDRVLPTFAQRWLAGAPQVSKIRATLGGPLDGTLRDEGVFHEDGLVKCPAHLTYPEAATLPCAALTAWSALEQIALRPGQTLVVQGTGGVSLFALQFAVMRGARVIVTSKSDEKLTRALALGATEGINYVKAPDWAKVVRSVTNNEGADAVIEVGGAGTLAQSIRAVKPGGTIALIGVLSGGSAEVNLTPILMQNIRIQGVLVGHREQFEAMNRAIEMHALRPVLDRSFALEDAATAFRAMETGAHFGKITVQMQRG